MASMVCMDTFMSGVGQWDGLDRYIFKQSEKVVTKTKS